MALESDKAQEHNEPRHGLKNGALNLLTALGIVFGDLGNSPLYTLHTIREAMGRSDASAMIGILSLIIWALILTISIKYCIFVMRADSNGEGGILILTSLLRGQWSGRGRWWLIAGLFGAALIYGDGIITPAISVLSAVEGLNVATNVFRPHIVSIAVGILLGLFAIQSWGTAKIGAVSGPVMLLWFVTIASLGVSGIVREPRVLAAFNPKYAVGFLSHAGWHGFVLLGGVFLAVTGGEALYADMGHVGKHSIRSAWWLIVLPALLISYAGQTALLLQQPDTAGNPFFQLPPRWAIFPLVVLATLATIIASQAIITGAFSLTRQATQLGWFPAMRIYQTSSEEYGQIYVPLVNWTMMLLTIGLTLAFRSSSRLAGAYGTAVSTTMLLTTLLLYKVMRDRWGWPMIAAIPLCGIFLTMISAFFAANLLKVEEGGWIPLTFGAAVFLLMSTWRTGTEAVRRKLEAITESTDEFFDRLTRNQIPRVAGTGVFLTRMTDSIPPPIIDHVAEVGALYRNLIALTVVFEEIPRVQAENRLERLKIVENFWHITVHFGFMEIPDLPQVLDQRTDEDSHFDADNALYFASRDQVIRTESNGIMRLRMPLFAFMFRNSLRTSDLFNLPPRRFFEIGRQVAI